MTRKISLWMMILIASFLTACSGGDDVKESGSESGESEHEYVVFRLLDLQTEGTSFVLTGDVHAEDGKFYYTVDQGGENVIEEQSVELSSADGWNEFEISGELPEEVKDKQEAPIITMYAKTEDGERANPNFIPVDIGIK